MDHWQFHSLQYGVFPVVEQHMYFDPYRNALAIFPISREFLCTYVQTVYVLSPLETIGGS